MTGPVDPAVIPADEEGRMAAVRRYDILDTPPDGAFDRVTALASRLFEAPIAIVSIVDRDRIWFKSHHGVDVGQIDRDPGLCASAILHDAPWVVEDARADLRTMANPLVAGDFGLGFYAGIPLTTSDGYGLGTLCVLDYEPRTADPDLIAHLEDLAAVVMDELELRRAARRSIGLEAAHRRSAEALASELQESLLPAQLPVVAGLDLAARYRPADREQVGGDFYDAFSSVTGQGLVIGDVSGHGPRSAALTSQARHTLHTLGLGEWSPARSLSHLNQVILDTPTAGERRFCTVAAVRLEPGPRTACATVALAGHPQPLVLRTDGSVEAIGSFGPFLGWRADPGYQEQAVELRDGDVLVLYTDGIIDGPSGQAHLDEPGLRAALGGLVGRTADEVADGLLDGFDAFDGTGTGLGQRDDIALLVARVC
jgi:sigma-B regulation protein RsbU (phosphoserine phosphatase)